MSRTPIKTVMVGGVIYAAGLPVPDEVADLITADVWGDDDSKPEPERPRKRTRARG